MSQKRRKPQKNQAAADGYRNPASSLGDLSPLLSSGTWSRSGITGDTELLTALYRESWIARKIIDMPSEDTTRAWYTLAADIAEEDLTALRRLEARHSVKAELTNAIRWARLYGGALALMVLRGEEDLLDTPLDPDRLLPGCFQGLLVLDRAQGIDPSAETVTDLDDPDFGLPAYYTVAPGPDAGPVRIHHSRVLRFTGRELPYTETVRENGWGASELEHVWEELQKRSATSANIAQLVFQANITTLKMSDFGETLAMGTDRQREQLLRAVEAQNRMRTSFGLQLLSADDSLETHPYSFAGLSEVYESFMLDMAGAAGIPATRLFGRAPQGMNATGESDLRNYYEMIAQLQERLLRPALDRLLPVMAVSCWGFCPDALDVVFEPFSTLSPAERAGIVTQHTDSVLKVYEAGLITGAQALDELAARCAPYGAFRNLKEGVKG